MAEIRFIGCTVTKPRLEVQDVSRSLVYAELRRRLRRPPMRGRPVLTTSTTGVHASQESSESERMGTRLAVALVLMGGVAVGTTELYAQQALPPPVVMAPVSYADHCASCHEPPEAPRAPTREALQQRSPEAIYEALTTGAMAAQGDALGDPQKQALAIFLSGRPFGDVASGHASAMPNRCEPIPLDDPLRGRAWNGWGADLGNSRFQSDPGISADEVPRLSLKWAFAFPNALSAYGQPATVGGRVYAGSDGGFVYSLDAETGCVYWSFEAMAGVRTAISLGPVSGGASGQFAVYFGDIHANVYAVDAATGELLWTQVADTHRFARITGAPALYDGRLFVPVSSLEEAAGPQPTYECCTFRGSVVAYDASTGEQLWKSYMIPVEPEPTRTTSVGTQLYGPSGAAVWSAPTIDVERHVLYVATGDAYSGPAEGHSDAVIAFDLDTGLRAWASQLLEGDVWIVGCSDAPGASNPENCPEDLGPDYDFGSNPILRTLADGRDILTVGQKSGIAWGLDPDRQGRVLWQLRVGKGSAQGGVQFGPAADYDSAYFATADAFAGRDAGGLTAVRLATGEQRWSTRPPCPEDGPCTPAQPAAVSVIPGAVFSGTLDGVMRAYSTDDGRIIWEYDSAREYTTVNEVPARGGGLNGPGPTIVDGMLFMNSGYSAIGGNAPGNVLLAFGVD